MRLLVPVLVALALAGSARAGVVPLRPRAAGPRTPAPARVDPVPMPELVAPTPAAPPPAAVESPPVVQERGPDWSRGVQVDPDVRLSFDVFDSSPVLVF